MELCRTGISILLADVGVQLIGSRQAQWLVGCNQTAACPQLPLTCLPPCPAACPAALLPDLQCKKIWATDHSSVGCGPECLNRMLNIECVEVRCSSFGWGSIGRVWVQCCHSGGCRGG